MHIDGRAGAIDFYCMRTQLYATAAIFVLHHHIQVVVKMLFMSDFFGTADRNTFCRKTTFSVCVARIFFASFSCVIIAMASGIEKKAEALRDIGDVALSLDQFKASWSASK